VILAAFGPSDPPLPRGDAAPAPAAERSRAPGLLGSECGDRPCPGCAGLARSVALSFAAGTVRLYVDGAPAYQRAGRLETALDDGRDHTVRVRLDVARETLTVEVDGESAPVLQQRVDGALLAPLAASGGYARVGFTAGTGAAETRPLVLRGMQVRTARASPGASTVRPAPADGVAGRVGRECEFTLQPRTACGLPSTLGAAWVIYVQAVTSALEGSVARGPPIQAYMVAGARHGPYAGGGDGGAPGSTSTEVSLRFEALHSGMHNVIVHEAAQSYIVGQILVLD